MIKLKVVNNYTGEIIRTVLTKDASFKTIGAIADEYDTTHISIRTQRKDEGVIFLMIDL